MKRMLLGIAIVCMAILCMASVAIVPTLAQQPVQKPAQQLSSTATEEQSAVVFEQHVLSLLKSHCVSCHNADTVTSGVRVDQLSDLTAAHEERHLRLWQNIRHQLASSAMPPKEEPQPTPEQRRATIQWIDQWVHHARSQPSPKHGLTRRLTVAQYRNTLRELLGLDEDLTEILPPDAVSRDGFLNNKETLQLSPLLLDAYFEIAGQALDRTLVQPDVAPTVETFRVDLGRNLNEQPCPDNLILGANNLLLRNQDFVVHQLPPRDARFHEFKMQTKFRFIEGYAGNDTVRGWREYDSIYHAVFACMRGSEGYPKGHAYDVVPSGLLLRPAIPSVEEFQVESTYGPKANFKISLRELPDHGRFRVTVRASKTDDGLMLDGADTLVDPALPDLLATEESTSIDVTQAGIYRIDAVKDAYDPARLPSDASQLAVGLNGYWPLDDGLQGAIDASGQPALVGTVVGDVKLIESPFGHALSLDGNGDGLTVTRAAELNVGEGDFTVAAWIHPSQLRATGIVSLGKTNWTHGWFLDMPDNRGTLRLETSGPESTSNGSIISMPGTIVNDAWQHVTAVVRRGENQSRLYVNGYPVAKGSIGPADLDNPKLDLSIGRIQGAPVFKGEIDEVRLYRRALGDAEIQALVAPGRHLVRPPTLPPSDLTLQLGDREMAGPLKQSAFVTLRLPAGKIALQVKHSGPERIGRIELRRLGDADKLAERFAAFEKRVPNLSVHLGLRRDCGSTLTQVGTVQPVSQLDPALFVFEGAIDDFPSPDVEKDNVNYLAGLREIGVRSEYTDGRDMPRLLIHSVQFEGPLYDSWPPAAHTQIMLPELPNEGAASYARRVLQSFATKAYRRPVTPAELEVLTSVAERSRAEGRSTTQSLRDALQVVLTSPQFLFLVETSQGPQAEPLNDFELASKLAYFLWNGPPDKRLLELAQQGEPHHELDAEITRMLADPRLHQSVTQFTSQWLALDKFQVLEPDRQRFPKLTREARMQLAEEPIQFMEYLLKENLPISLLLESKVIMANEIVASYYDLGNRVESGFKFQPVEHGRSDLGGLLSNAAILAGLSDGRQANPIKRGAWIARRIIAEPPDDPPPNVPNLKQETEHLPLRERLEQHRNQTGCAQCHAKIDPYGIPLEEYDAGGRHKSEFGDVRSQLPDQAMVAGANDLKRYLAHDRIDQVAFSFIKHMTIYACGRDLSYYELEWLKQNSAQLKSHDYATQDSLRWIIHSPIFLEK